MEPIITQEPYTFANVKHSRANELLTITGYRMTYTPSTRDTSTILPIQEQFPTARILYPRACASLLTNLLPKGGRVLDLTPENGEFVIASNMIPRMSYTGIDPREEIRSLVREFDTERITVLEDQESMGDGEDKYDLVILPLTRLSSLPKEFMNEGGILLIRGTEGSVASPSFRDCWGLPMAHIYGCVGIRNIEGTCDAFMIARNGETPIELPDPVQGTHTVLSRIRTNPIPERAVQSMVSYQSKSVPYLSNHPYACVQYTRGLHGTVGIITKESMCHPLTYLGLFNRDYIDRGPITLHVFEYESDTPNRSIAYVFENIIVNVHTHTSTQSCETHAKYLFDDLTHVIGLGGEDVILPMIADGIVRVMGMEQVLIDIRGSHDLLAQGISHAYSQADLRLNMSACTPETLTYAQSTRDNSRVYFTNTLARKIPSMIVNPEEPEYPIEDFTHEQMISLAETNLPQYTRPGTSSEEGEDSFVPVSPPAP
jgi:hypothetical protein